MKKFFYLFIFTFGFIKSALCIYTPQDHDMPTYVGADNEKLICSGITNLTCQNASSEPYTGLAYQYQFGALYQEFNLKNGKMDGEFKFYNRSDGTVREIGHYEDGKLTDRKTYYDYKNGILWTEYIYKDSTGENFYKHYYENGQVELEGKRKHGKSDGVEKRYYKNGQLERETFWKDGKLDGICREYYESGQLKTEKKYENHEQVDFKAYDENGKPMSKKDYEKRKKLELFKGSEGMIIRHD